MAAREKSQRIGVFPGSFDPIHNGHLDLVERSLGLFDQVIVAVLDNESKRPVFTVEERVEMLEELFERRASVRIESFSGLLVDFARAVSAGTLIRGLRTGADFDYELPMALMNRRLFPELETIFLVPRAEYADLSSSLIKEVCRLGGEVSGLLPEGVRKRLEGKLRG